MRDRVGRHPLFVQIVRDFTRCSAIHIIREDTPNHFGLGIDDYPLAILAGTGSISVSQAASSQSFANTAGLTAPHLVGVVFAVELSDKATKFDQDRVDDSLVNRPDIDPKK